jgi:hypothetical protein
VYIYTYTHNEWFFSIIKIVIQKRFIKKQRFNWLGHVEIMAEDNIVHKIKIWKPMSKRPIGRPKTRWEDEVLEATKSINVSNWKKVAQNRDRRKWLSKAENYIGCSAL